MRVARPFVVGMLAALLVGAATVGSGVTQRARAQQGFEVELAVGWNLVSWLGEEAGVKAALGGAAGAVGSVHTFDAESQGFETYTVGGPAFLNSLTTIPTGAGVWLLAEQAVTWSQPRREGARSVPLVTGFNLVAWTGPDATPVADAVAGLGGALESIFLWDTLAETFLTFGLARPAFLNSAEVLNYGDGLWALIRAPATWQQPAATAPSNDTPPSTPGASGRIAFESVRGGVSDIYVMNADGSGKVNLTNDPATDQFPAWSPDGSRIAFDSFRDGSSDIFIMNADGTGVTGLNTNGGSRAAWSPDGSRIAFSATGNIQSEIFVINATARARPVSPPSGHGTPPGRPMAAASPSFPSVTPPLISTS